MPVLPICDGHGALKEDAAFTCWATMLFPDDEEKREQTAWLSFAASLVDDLATAGERSVLIGIDELAALMAAPQPSQVSATVDPRIARGCIAGDVLRHIVLLSGHCPEHAAAGQAPVIPSPGSKRNGRSDQSGIDPHWGAKMTSRIRALDVRRHRPRSKEG